MQVRQRQPAAAFGTGNQFDLENDPKGAWTRFRSLWIMDRDPQAGGYSGGEPSGRPSPAPLPSVGPRPPSTGTQLGVKDNWLFSSMTGTKLSILGTTIDITSFDAPDLDGPLAGTSSSTPVYNKSLQSLYNSLVRINPPIDALMPSREDAFSYSEWYFCMVGAFVPLLHKPTYLALVNAVLLSIPGILLGLCPNALFLSVSSPESTTIATSSQQQQTRSLYTWYLQSCTTSSVSETVTPSRERPS